MVARSALDFAGDWAFGHYTHEKNPVTSAAALTTIEIIKDEGLIENARAVGAYALDRLKEMKSRHPLVGDVCGLGLMLGVELVRDRDSKSPARDAEEAIAQDPLAFQEDDPRERDDDRVERCVDVLNPDPFLPRRAAGQTSMITRTPQSRR